MSGHIGGNRRTLPDPGAGPMSRCNAYVKWRGSLPGLSPVRALPVGAFARLARIAMQRGLRLLVLEKDVPPAQL
jgi:hypothetical protein